MIQAIENYFLNKLQGTPTEDEIAQQEYNKIINRCGLEVSERINQKREREMELSKYRYEECERPKGTCEQFFNYKDCIIEVFHNGSEFRVLAPSGENNSGTMSSRLRMTANATSKMIDMGLTFYRQGDAMNFIEDIND